jgi:adenosylhomocysteine nucleosidase
MAIDASWSNRLQDSKPGIRWVVAYPAEAKPILRWFGLVRRINADPFTVYSNEDRTHWLIISGPGKENAAAATMFLYTYSRSGAAHAWLNLGVAGHRDLALGTAVWVDRVTDAETKKSWYPGLVFETPLTNAQVTTVTAPERKYETSSMFDMESAGFYAASSRLTSHELIHCIKVVSDNASSPIENITAAKSATWINGIESDVRHFCDELIGLSKEECKRLADPLFYAEFLQSKHFTKTQQHQLRRLLLRWESLYPEQPATRFLNKAEQNSKGLLLELERSLDPQSFLETQE